MREVESNVTLEKIIYFIDMISLLYCTCTVTGTHIMLIFENLKESKESPRYIPREILNENIYK